MNHQVVVQFEVEARDEQAARDTVSVVIQGLEGMIAWPDTGLELIGRVHKAVMLSSALSKPLMLVTPPDFDPRPPEQGAA